MFKKSFALGFGLYLGYKMACKTQRIFDFVDDELHQKFMNWIMKQPEPKTETAES